MKQIMTVRLSDGSEREVLVTESIVSSNFFCSFMGRDLETNERVEVRVETEDNYNDRKERNC